MLVSALAQEFNKTKHSQGHFSTPKKKFIFSYQNIQKSKCEFLPNQTGHSQGHLGPRNTCGHEEKGGVKFCSRPSDPRGSTLPNLIQTRASQPLMDPGGDPGEGRCKPHRIKATYRPRPWRFGGTLGKIRCKLDQGSEGSHEESVLPSVHSSDSSVTFSNCVNQCSHSVNYINPIY